MKLTRGSLRALVALSVLLPAAHATAQITEYAIPTASSGPIGIVAGPDGALWFTEAGASKIGRITTAGVITEFPIPTVGSHPVGITVGPPLDGALWFVEQDGNKIGRITTAGAITEFPIPSFDSGSIGITSGPDGALWFCESQGSTGPKIGRVTTAGVFMEYTIMSDTSVAPAGIVAGPDGALWFTELGNPSVGGIGRITTAGVITDLPHLLPNRGPLGITVGPDNALWFAESNGVRIDRMTTGFAFSGFNVPPPSVSPNSITVGPDGAFWFTDGFRHVGRMTTSGAFSILTLPPPAPPGGPRPQNIVAGSDGALWFTEYGSNKIGRVTTDVITMTSITPASGPSTGASGVTIAGTSFDPAATPTVGGMAAGNVTVNGPTQITLDVPALTPGGLFDVTVTNPDSSVAVLPKGWFADFLDVPGSSGFHSFVEKLVRHQVTAGCGGGSYCPSDSVTRAQMAVFLLRSKEGPIYTPPACSVPTFTDVPCTSGFAPWVNELAVRGVTAGCGGGNYCPADPVNRAQMAVFLLTTLEGSGYVPPACVTPTFADVPCSSGFARWVDELAARGITAGCGSGNYCPANAVTRAQMAVFLVTTFALP